MKKTTLPYELEIAPYYTVEDWCHLTFDPVHPNSPDWETALKIFDARIRKRFLNPVDVLIAHEISFDRKTFGFAILAIDFLVIETLQGFKEGTEDHRKNSKGLITRFLKNWSAFKDSFSEGVKLEKVADEIYSGYRCALHHSGSTNKAFRVGVSGPIVKINSGNDIKINRTRFHDELKREFDNYLEELRQPEKEELRENFLKKMNHIAGFSSKE